MVWLRLLTLSMGHTTRAVGILLAAFMGGLAAGAYLAGRRAASGSARGALQRYAALEAGLAGYALILPSLLAAAGPWLAGAYADGDGGARFDAALAMTSLLLLALPAAAMGATYPLAVRACAGAGPEPQSQAGSLYAANTVGAAIGAALTGFVLLPALGVRGATWVGVVLNVAAAAGAVALAGRGAGAPVALPERNGDVAAPVRADRAGSLRVVAAALALSGLVSLIYQVTWTRLLAMTLGPTTYAFGAMLAAVIGGLALGAVLAARRPPATPRAARLALGSALIAAAATALLAALAADRLPLLVAGLVSRPGVTFDAVLAMQAALVVAIQLPMTMAFGAAFPFGLAAIRSGPGAAPRDASILYAVNTAGAIAGALAASFVLVPFLGLQASMRLAALVAVGAGLAVCWHGADGSRARGLVAAASAAVVLLAAATPAWSQARLANGGYRYAGSGGDIAAGLDAGRLVYYREGAAGTVSVRDVPGARSLAIDGKVDASNASDMLTQKLLAHLPLLLHPDPRRVCVIGLGSGVTLGAALAHPVERVDVVEISPEVVEASSFFARENHDALADPRTRLVVGDGRTHLLLARRQYDVIISEPSNPWMAGIAALFTREFFEAARARLAPGGLLLQWAHTYSISDVDLRSIVATFLSVFPEGTAWLVADGDLLLVGSTSSLPALDAGLDAAWARPGVAADLAEVEVRDPFSVLSLYVAGGRALGAFAAGAPIQTDDRLQLEYSAPRAIYGRFQQSNVAQLRALAAGGTPPGAVARAAREATPVQWRNRGLMLLEADAGRAAYDDLSRAVVGRPQDPEALRGFARAAARGGRLDEAERTLDRLARETRAAPVFVELSVVRASLGRQDAAVEAAREGVLASPADPAALRQLASMYGDRGDEEGLERLIELAEAAQAGPAVTQYARARLAYLRGDFAEAVGLSEQAAAADPGDGTVHALLGSAYATLGQFGRAQAALEASLRTAPTDPGILVNLGLVALRSGDVASAAGRFAEALFVSPAHPGALNGLADAYERQGDTRRAAALRRLAAGS